MADLSVEELYILLGYHWLHAATSIGNTCRAHVRMAEAMKGALQVAGEPSARIEEKLAHCLAELGINPSA